MQTLSPRKFVQSRVRTLPVIKCLVNADWEETRIAQVTIMRQHANGHVTIGIFVIDLLCLGVKDTLFFFNTPPEDFMQQYGQELSGFSEIDYELAHNIVYAGHDFAQEFNIPPHRDFAITRFILEEDSHAVPFVEVPVGVEGVPHLIESYAGECADVLTRLKHYAGEGNYYHSVEQNRKAAMPQEAEEEAGLFMDDIAPGEIGLGNVQLIHSEDLLVVEKVQQRTLPEQLTIHAELLTRLLPADINTCSEQEDQLWHEMWDEIGHAAAQPNHIQEAQFEEHLQLTKRIDVLTDLLDRNDEQSMKRFEQQLLSLAGKYPQNPLCVQSIYEQAILLDLEQLTAAMKEMAGAIYEPYPVLHFSLALGGLIQQVPDDRFENIYTQTDIRYALPGYQQYHAAEIISFWLIKLWLCLEQKDLKSAVQYYYLLVDAKAASWLLLPVLEKYVEVLYKFKERQQ
jgi:hypothetical protein